MRALAMTALVFTCLLVLSGQAGADAAQTLTVADATANEADGTLTFQVKLSEGSDSATFNYATADRTAKAGTDYTAKSSLDAVPIAAGGTYEISVQLANDGLDEEPETFELNLSNIKIGEASQEPVTAVGTITDHPNDTPPVATITNVDTDGVVVEGGDATFTVSLSKKSGREVRVSYRTVDGSAVAPKDYETKAPGTIVSIPAGETTGTIKVQTVNDLDVEGDEAFSVALGDPNETVAIGNPNSASVTIKDNETGPTLSVVGGEVAEGNQGDEAAELQFTVKLSAAVQRQVAVTVSTRNGTAVAPDDYDVTTERLTFVAGQTEKPFKVTVVGDNIDELNETVLAVLSEANGAEIGGASAEGTILDDDNNSVIAVADTSVNEPTSGTGTMTFTVSLGPESKRPVSVAWRTADGTATAGSDYTAASGVVQFAAGETSKPVSIELLADAVNEDNETMRLLLSDPQGVGPGKLVDAEAQGTIIDKNAPPSLSISDATTREGEGATFTVTLAGTTNRTVTVSFSTADGTAKAGSDYVPRVGTLSFAPGEKTKTLSVTVLDDDAAEPMEDFSMRLGDPQNGTITKAIGRALIDASDTVAAPPTPPVATPVTRPAPAVVKAPRMVLGPRTVAVTAAGLARMTVTCQRTSPIACSGTVELERAARPLLKLGKRAFTVRKGAKGVAAVKLSARSLAILRRTGTMRVRVIVVYKTSVGTARAVPGVVTLIAPKVVQPKPKPKPVEEPTRVEVTP